MDPYDWFGQGQPESPFAAEALPQPNPLGGPPPEQTERPKPQPKPQSSSHPLAGLIGDAAKKHGVNPTTLGAMMMIESGGNPSLVNKYGYSGLFQFQPRDFAKRGGQGSVLDPAANADVGARKFAEMSKRFEAQRGRPPTSGELYLMHQQGEGGAAAHWDAPERPAWQSMLSTGEGRQKGPDWARRAIWDNVPSDVKSRFGSVDNITSRDFAQLWSDKVGRFEQRFSGGAEPQITSQVGSPTASAQPAPSAASRGQPGMLDKLLSAIGITPAAAAEAQPPANSEAMIASLGRMGITPDSPEFGAFSELAKALSAGKKPTQERSGAGKAFDVFSDTLGTGLLQRGGLKVPLLADQRHAASSKERQALEERAYQAQLSLLGTALPHRMKDIERQRREATMRSVMGGGQPLAPGGAGGVQLPPSGGVAAPPPSAGPGAPPVGPQMPPGPTAAPMPVDRGALPEPGAENLAPESEAPTTPQPLPQIPQMPPAPQQAAPTGSPPSIAPQPAPASAAPGAAPAAPQGGSKYRGVTPDDLDRQFPMPHPQQRIDALIAGGYDKEADNLRQANELMLKRRDQYIKMHEVSRATDDPESAKAKETAKLDAKREGDLLTMKQKAGLALKGIGSELQSLTDFADSGKMKSGHIGPWDSSDEPIIGGPLGYIAPSGKTAGRILNSFDPSEWGGANPEQTRTMIEQSQMGILNVAKKLVREAGEGTFSEGDQALLNKLVGELPQARNITDFKERVANLREVMQRVFAAPLGLELPKLTGKDGAQPAGAGLTPGKATEIQRRYQSADPAMKAAIEKSLVDKGIDPKTVLGGAPAAPAALSMLPEVIQGTPMDKSLNSVMDRLRAGGGSGLPAPAVPQRPRSFPGHLIDGEAF